MALRISLFKDIKLLAKPSSYLCVRTISQTNILQRRIPYGQDYPNVPKISHEFNNIIKWQRPDYLDPWEPERSGDIEGLPKIDPNWLQLEYRPFADKINALPEDQRKLFTVGFAKRSAAIDLLIEDTASKVRRHKWDNESLDYRIARHTIRIRSFADILSKVTNDKDLHRYGFMKLQCHSFIGRRARYLRELRKEDYKRFEWIIEVLGLIYRSPPPLLKHERKKALVQLTNIYCQAIKRKKLNEYKQVLEAQKIPFLEEKLATLEVIKQDEASMNLQCSVQEEIDNTKKRLEKLKSEEMLELKPLEEEEVSLIPYYQMEITRPWHPTDNYYMPKKLYGLGKWKPFIPARRWI